MIVGSLVGVGSAWAGSQGRHGRPHSRFRPVRGVGSPDPVVSLDPRPPAAERAVL